LGRNWIGNGAETLFSAKNRKSKFSPPEGLARPYALVAQPRGMLLVVCWLFL